MFSYVSYYYGSFCVNICKIRMVSGLTIGFGTLVSINQSIYRTVMLDFVSFLN